MDQHHTDHAPATPHGGAHLPEPSIWPLVAAVSALGLGFVLLWWAKDTSSDLTSPFLGAAIVVSLLAACGWVYEDTRVRRKTDQAALAGGREARYTQVITFAIAEGQLTAARSVEGILGALDQSDSALRNLAGFQDLRIVFSPAEAGTSQVLVETTWSGRDTLATYEETRRTLLDTVNAHASQLAPGSIQVFDMEVVRDTKDVTFRMGAVAAALLLGTVIVGGFAVGAGLNIFKKEGTVVAANGGGTTPAADTGTVTATDNKFDKAKLEAPPNTAVTFTFKNTGKAKHNLHFLDKEGGKTLADGSEGKIIDGGQSDSLGFKTPGAGTYYFQCDIHPTEMKGTLEVKEGAAVPGQAAAAGGGGAAAGGANAVTATDNKFDKATLEAAAGKEVSITFTNNGKALHNFSVMDKEGGKAFPGATSEIIPTGKSVTVKFTAPAAGTYYFQCDIHPAEMKGKFVVK